MILLLLYWSQRETESSCGVVFGLGGRGGGGGVGGLLNEPHSSGFAWSLYQLEYLEGVGGSMELYSILLFYS